MSKPIAVTGAMQICPINGKSPHVGGTFDKGSSLVYAQGKAVLRQGDQSQCKTGGPTTIQSGCASFVFVEGKPLACMGSITSHGGQITQSNCTFIFID